MLGASRHVELSTIFAPVALQTYLMRWTAFGSTLASPQFASCQFSRFSNQVALFSTPSQSTNRIFILLTPPPMLNLQRQSHAPASPPTNAQQVAGDHIGCSQLRSGLKKVQTPRPEI